MCRWLGYFGNPVRPDWLLYRAGQGLIEQSLAAREMDHPVNGDGFGLGWYGTADSPGLYRSVAPAWSDRNLRELCTQLTTPLYLAHVRASTGAPVQETNCHPFRYGRWLFVHNGFIDGYAKLRRELMFAVDPELFGSHPGHDRLRAAVLPRAHVRPRGGAAARARAHGGLRRGHRPPRTASSTRSR